MSQEIEALPLSLAQRRLWFVHRAEPDSSVYNVAMGLRLRGALDATSLRRSLETVVERHESLRTTFEMIDGEPVQVFHDRVEVPWEEVDLSHLEGDVDSGPQGEAVDALESEETGRPFDLVRGPLLRSHLLRLGPEDHLWLVIVHHIVFDGWSQEVLIGEVSALYQQLAGRPDGTASLPELPIQYADFAVWQEERLDEAEEARLVDFWRRELDGYPTLLRLPTDRPRPARQTSAGDTVVASLDGETVERIRAVGEVDGTTPFVFFAAVWLSVLQRLTGRDRMLSASPSAGRGHPDAEGLIGCFVHTLVIRGDLSGDLTFAELSARMRGDILRAMAHEALPFERIVEVVRPERHPGYSPLTQVGLSVDSFALTDRELAPGLVASPRHPAIAAARADLSLMVKLYDDRTTLLLEYNSDLFDRSTAERWLGYVVAMVRGALDRPDAALSRLPILSAEERQLLVERWPRPVPPAEGPHGTGADRWETSIGATFLARVAESPEAVAIETDDERLTYRQLAERSAGLARRLRAEGVGRGLPVAVALDRSVGLLLTLLAVVRAGGHYVPVDLDYPEERRRLMIEDSEAPLLVTRRGLADRLGETPGARVVLLEELTETPDGDGADLPLPEIGPDDLAYLIFTSGSTGQPKGVAVTHRGVVRLVLGGDHTAFGPGESMLHASSISFDAATAEIWGPLLTGGRVVVLGADLATPAAVLEAAERHGVTRLFLTTALFDRVAERPEDLPATVQSLGTGGEAASPAAFRAMLAARPDLQVSNLYGPTENTSYSTHHRLSRADEVGASVPIGRAVAGSTCWVFDRSLEPAPIGVEGELLVGGAGLARGYRGAPGATAERFVPHPYAERPGERLYRTGDMVRWLPSGVLEFVGREDLQVKIRGFRIELGEVEAALAALPGVVRAAVVIRPVAGEPALVGYYLGEGEDPISREEVRSRLRESLPAFMVPAALMRLDEMPITAGGKVDREALPAPHRSLGTEREGYGAPRTPLEQEIARQWGEILGVEGVGIHDDFFALGGHSLLATRILARLSDDFGLEVSLKDFFAAPTVAGLAATLGSLLLAEEQA